MKLFHKSIIEKIQHQKDAYRELTGHVATDIVLDRAEMHQLYSEIYNRITDFGGSVNGSDRTYTFLGLTIHAERQGNTNFSWREYY